MSAFSRVIVVAPTRSACSNLHHLLGLAEFPETLLLRVCGSQLKDAINNLHLGGFGIIAGTGAGKSGAIREICKNLLGAYTVGMVTMEHKASEMTAKHPVLVITPGVAQIWALEGKITKNDLVIYDEIHQTSAHLEMTMALNKRHGITAVWMSATIDPSVYRDYLEARTVIECDAYDPALRAQVKLPVPMSSLDYLSCELPRLIRAKSGIAVFVPTRAEAEDLSKKLGEKFSGLHTDFYHGGESADKLKAFLSGGIPRPFVVCMTSAGASSLNIAGLNTVVIVDERFTTVIEGGRKRLKKLPLDNNTILQMAGRVNGRAVNGEVHILTDRELDFDTLEPTVPEFELSGSLEQLALITAKQRLDISDLELIDRIDTDAYASVFSRLVERKIIQMRDGIPGLTSLGRRLLSLPLDTAWGELVLKAHDQGDDELLQVVVAAACLPEIYKLTTRKWRPYQDKNVLQGSDHLTVANIFGDAVSQFGKRHKNGYSFMQGPFRRWYEESNYMGKELRNAALLMVSIYYALKHELPRPQDFAEIKLGSELHQRFLNLLLTVQSLEYVQGQKHSSFPGQVYGNSRNGVSNGSSTIGSIRQWTDSAGRLAATVEGTDVSAEVVLGFARQQIVALGGISLYGEQLRLRVYVKDIFAGEELERRSSGYGYNFDPEAAFGRAELIAPESLLSREVASVVRLTEDAVHLHTWQLLTHILPAHQQVDWPGGRFVENTKGTVADIQERVRAWMNETVLYKWLNGNRPTLSVPDLSDPSVQLPKPASYEYGKDALTDEPLMVYGVLAVYPGHVGGELVTNIRWIIDESEANRVHEAAKEFVQTQCKEVEALLEHRKMQDRAERYTQRATALWTLRLRSGYPHLAERLNPYRYMPHRPQQDWFTAADAAIEAAEMQLAKLDKICERLRPMQAEMIKLAETEPHGQIDDDTYNELHDLASRQLDLLTGKELEEWEAQAEKAMAHAKAPKAQATQDSLEELAALFNARK